MRLDQDTYERLQQRNASFAQVKRAEIEGLTVLLPYPVGANRVWRSVRGRVIENPKAKEWKRLAAGLMAGRVMLEAGVSVEYVLHPRKNKNGTASKTRLDVDAPAKALLDALSGVCYRDDKQVMRITGSVGEPVINGGLSVRVEQC